MHRGSSPDYETDARMFLDVTVCPENNSKCLISLDFLLEMFVSVEVCFLVSSLNE